MMPALEFGLSQSCGPIRHRRRRFVFFVAFRGLCTKSRNECCGLNVLDHVGTCDFGDGVVYIAGQENRYGDH